MLGKAQILPLGVVRGQRWVWKPGLQRVAEQAPEWILEIVKGQIKG